MSEASIDSSIQIVTPENIAFEYRVAGPFLRLPAYLIDVLVRIAIFVPISLLVVFFFGGLGVMMALIIYFLLEWFYGGVLEATWNGQTVGKRMIGLRVLGKNGQPINGFQAVLRNLLRFADLMPLLSVEVLGIPAPAYSIPTGVIGVVWCMLSPRYQRLGDFVCGTMVVVEERHWMSGVAKLEDPRAFELASLLPASFKISRSMARAIAHYVERRNSFPPGKRRDVAGKLAKPLLVQFGFPHDVDYDLLLCAIYYRAFVADRGKDEEHAREARAALVGGQYQRN